MKRSPLKRKTPMARTGRAGGRGQPLARKRPDAGAKTRPKRRNAYARRDRGFDFMGFVARQRCTVAAIGLAGVSEENPPSIAMSCFGPIQVDHVGERIGGKGTRSKDRDTAAMCLGHHQQRTEYRGVFAGLTREEHRAWCAAAIAHTHELARQQGQEIPTC